jgi:hypothetical protein
MKGDTVTMTNEARECCQGLEPAGLTCGGCGRHFHVGTELLDDDGRVIECPRCESSCAVVDLEGEVKEPSHLKVVELMCEGVEAEVADRIRNVAKTRTSSDPNYWINVATRETWKYENGSYDEWDKAAEASGLDPTLFGPVGAVSS